MFTNVIVLLFSDTEERKLIIDMGLGDSSVCTDVFVYLFILYTGKEDNNSDGHFVD